VRRRGLIAVLLLAVLLVLAHALLPFALERYVNRVLDRNESYTGRVEDIDVALWRGAYVIDGVRIDKRGGRVPVPFFRAQRVDLSIEWRALFEGALVGEVHFERPQLNFVSGPAPAQRQGGGGADWRRMVEELSPVKINRAEVHEGTVHFRNFHSDPEVDVYLRDVRLVAANLTNSKDLSDDRVARIRLRARPMDRGRLWARVEADPFAESPDFDLDGAVTGADLTEWNDFLRAYAGIDVQEGSFSVYFELLAHSRRFEGYLKPFVEDLDVLRLEEEADEQGPLASLWEALVGGSAEIVEDQPNDRQATRIPLSGTIEDPRASLWAALGGALRNAFVERLRPQLEGSVGEH
jgi:hypothetical protein